MTFLFIYQFFFVLLNRFYSVIFKEIMIAAFFFRSDPKDELRFLNILRLRRSN